MKALASSFLLITSLLNPAYASTFIEYMQRIDKSIEDKKRELVKDIQAYERRRGSSLALDELPPLHQQQQTETFCKAEIEEVFNFLEGKENSDSMRTATQAERVAALTTLSQTLIVNHSLFWEMLSKVERSLSSFQGENLRTHQAALYLMMVGINNTASNPLGTLDYDGFISAFSDSISLYKYSEDYEHLFNNYSLFEKYTTPQLLKALLPQDFFMEFYKRAFDYLPLSSGMRDPLSAALALKEIHPTKEDGFLTDCTFSTEDSKEYSGIIRVKRSDQEEWEFWVADRSEDRVINFQDFSNTYIEPINLSRRESSDRKKTYCSLLSVHHKKEDDPFSVPYAFVYSDGILAFFSFIANPDFHGRFLAFTVPAYERPCPIPSTEVPYALELTNHPCTVENWGIMDNANLSPLSLEFTWSLVVKNIRNSPSSTIPPHLNLLVAFFYSLYSNDMPTYGSSLRLSQIYYLYQFIEEKRNKTEQSLIIAQTSAYIKALSIESKSSAYTNEDLTKLIIYKATQWIQEPQKVMDGFNQRFSGRLLAVPAILP